jgi:hypothetical protein
MLLAVNGVGEPRRETARRWRAPTRRGHGGFIWLGFGPTAEARRAVSSLRASGHNRTRLARQRTGGNGPRSDACEPHRVPLARCRRVARNGAGTTSGSCTPAAARSASASRSSRLGQRSSSAGVCSRRPVSGHREGTMAAIVPRPSQAGTSIMPDVITSDSRRGQRAGTSPGSREAGIGSRPITTGICLSHYWAARLPAPTAGMAADAIHLWTRWLPSWTSSRESRFTVTCERKHGDGGRARLSAPDASQATGPLDL